MDKVELERIEQYRKNYLIAVHVFLKKGNLFLAKLCRNGERLLLVYISARKKYERFYLKKVKKEVVLSWIERFLKLNREIFRKLKSDEFKLATENLSKVDVFETQNYFIEDREDMLITLKHLKNKVKS